MRRIALLGATGSIGASTLSVVEAHPERFRVVAMAAGRNLERLVEAARRHRPELVSVARREDVHEVAAALPGTRVAWGPEGLVEVACHPGADTVVAALVGSVGLVPTLEAIRLGRRIALANKETLVVAGELVMAAAARHGAEILPVDSEHNAIHQALRVGPREAVRRLVLTASGGPFRDWPAGRIERATPEEALAHPTWRMGPKITVDSATMMNKGLEVIEAHHLFGVPAEAIEVVIHRESLVHSLVEYVDGSYIAQIGPTDMRLPVMYALAYPERLPPPVPRLELAAAGRLTFEAPDPERFPALDLARAALAGGGELPAVLNAANEVAVAAFLDRRIPFGAIARTVAATLDAWTPRNRPVTSLDQVLAADREARALAEVWIEEHAGRAGGSLSPEAPPCS